MQDIVGPVRQKLYIPGASPSLSQPREQLQTDKSRDLPLLVRAATMNLRLLNPDFEYVFFDDAQVEDFIDTEFPQYHTVVESFSIRIQRYLTIHQFLVMTD